MHGTCLRQQTPPRSCQARGQGAGTAMTSLASGPACPLFDLDSSQLDTVHLHLRTWNEVLSGVSRDGAFPTRADHGPADGAVCFDDPARSRLVLRSTPRRGANGEQTPPMSEVIQGAGSVQPTLWR